MAAAGWSSCSPSRPTSTSCSSGAPRWRRAQALSEEAHLPAQTPNGRRLSVMVNVESLRDLDMFHRGAHRWARARAHRVPTWSGPSSPPRTSSPALPARVERMAPAAGDAAHARHRRRQAPAYFPHAEEPIRPSAGGGCGSRSNGGLSCGCGSGRPCGPGRWGPSCACSCRWSPRPGDHGVQAIPAACAPRSEAGHELAPGRRSGHDRGALAAHLPGARHPGG